ncbi:DMT family transporter [Psychromicrobium xiongbiense]|uniref:DMT family transporter n=1 Tax=Psychromicrobium xiongbiense TaxID=3051184 RepID=UPI002552148F|nr:DMT family transporter [Psychromicrobium sp. YIM S02556]
MSRQMPPDSRLDASIPDVSEAKEQPLSRGAVIGLSVLMTLLFAGTWIFSGLLIDHHSPQVVATGRTLFTCLGLLLIAGRSRGALRRSVQEVVRRPWALLISGLLGVAIYAWFSLAAMSLVGTSVTNLVITLSPAFTLVFGVLFFRERSSWFAAAAVLLAVLGAAVYVLGSFGDPVPGGAAGGAGYLWGVAAAVVAVSSIALYGQHYARISRGHRPTDLLLGIFGFGAIVLLILTAATGSLGEYLTLSALDWLWFFVLGVVIYVPVYIIQHRLIHDRGAVFTATLGLATPFVIRISEVLLGWKTWPNAIELIGMLACLAGVAAVIRQGTRKLAD